MTTLARPPILLTMADYYGTLAAVRCLGRLGIPITVAESKLLAPARWSRYVTRRVECPDVGDSDAFLEWLMRFGEREPGHVLYPTSDDMAWLFALHREELGRHFLMYQPGVDVIYGLLNKQRLHDLCKDVGLDVPETWFPEGEKDLERVAAEARFPVLLKPQTQILFESHVKGAQVERASELLPRYREFLERNRYGRKLLDQDPKANRPMVQAFYPEAAQNIFSLSGFVDRTGELFVARGAVKVLQRPRKLGIGLCFEEVPVEPVLAEKLRALCKKLGYHGTFELEFIRAGGKQLLIDFNPRFYSQMGFDIARGKPAAADGVRGGVRPRGAARRGVARGAVVEGRGPVHLLPPGHLRAAVEGAGPVGPAVVGRGEALARVVRAQPGACGGRGHRHGGLGAVDGGRGHAPALLRPAPQGLHPHHGARQVGPSRRDRPRRRRAVAICGAPHDGAAHPGVRSPRGPGRGCTPSARGRRAPFSPRARRERPAVQIL